MKLHRKLHASHTLSVLIGQVYPFIPLFMYPDCFDNLTASSFPDLTVATLVEVIVSYRENLSYERAKIGCNTNCSPFRNAPSVHQYPLSNMFTKEIFR